MNTRNLLPKPPRWRNLVVEGEAARRLDVDETYLRKRRNRGEYVEGHHFIRVGRKVYYLWPVLYEIRRPT